MVNGKINFILADRERLYVPVQMAEQTGILVYEQQNGQLIQSGFIKTGYFYSYGAVKGDRGYFASFSSGADSIIDLKEEQELDIFEYNQGMSGR